MSTTSSDSSLTSGLEVSRPSRGPETGHAESNSVEDDRNPRSRRGFASTPGGIRTPNLLIRSQKLYPLSYGRIPLIVQEGSDLAANASTPGRQAGVGRMIPRRW